MEELIIKTILSKETVFAILFIWLLFRQIKQSEQREEKLYTFLSGMKEEFSNLVKHYERLSSDVEDIKQEIRKGEK